MRNERRNILVWRDAKELSQRAAELFVRLAIEATSATGRFMVALSGGSTPKILYSLLAGNEFQSRVPWSKVFLFWGDERCIPPDHAESNYGMTQASLLSKVPLREENVYRIPAQKEVNRAAAEYEQTLTRLFGLAENETPRFDLILLGMGTDGHTASLFPGTAALRETGPLVTANYVAKLKAYRITVTTSVINRAANVMFLVSGAAKASTLKEVLEGRYEPNRLPAQLIRPVDGKLFFMVDRAAASELSGACPTNNGGVDPSAV